MTNLICYRCDYNLVYFEYKEERHLDEHGNKPCHECLVELEAEYEEKNAALDELAEETEKLGIK